MSKVSRKDLFKDSDESESENDYQEFIPRIQLEFTEVDNSIDKDDLVDIDIDTTETDKQEQSFNLFGEQKVLDLHESVDPEPMAIKRPQTYYMSSFTDEEKTRMEFCAVTGEEIIKQHSVKLPGMELPWKVTDYTALAKKVKFQNRKIRPGKAKRLRMRDAKANSGASGFRDFKKFPQYGPSATYSMTFMHKRWY